MNGVIGAIVSQPLSFTFRARRPEEVILLCKATVLEECLEVSQFIRFRKCIQSVSDVPCEGNDKSEAVLEIEFPRILKKPGV